MLVPWLVGKDQEHCALNKVELRKELLYNHRINCGTVL